MVGFDDILDEFSEKIVVVEEDPLGPGPRFRYFEHIDGDIIEVDTEEGEVIYNTPGGNIVVVDNGLFAIKKMLHLDLIRDVRVDEVDDMIDL